MSQRWSAQGLIDLVLDDGSFESWDQPIDITRPLRGLPGRAARGRRAGGHRRVGAHRARAGARSAGRRRGQRVRLPRRLDRPGGRAADRRRAYAARPPRGCPLLATTASGGTRMQEGTPAFFEMVDDLAGGDGPPGGRAALPGAPAPPDHRRRLRVVGLARPRDRRRAGCARRLPRARRSTRRSRGSRSRPGSSRPRTSPSKGVIDAVVSTEDLPDADRPDPGGAGGPRRRRRRCPLRSDAASSSRPVWESVELTRSAERLGVRDLLRYAARGTVALNGTEEGEQDAAVLVDADPARRPAVRAGRPGPGAPDAARPRSARRPCAQARRGHAARRGARPAARHRDRHPGRRALARGRGGRASPARSPAASPPSPR